MIIIRINPDKDIKRKLPMKYIIKKKQFFFMWKNIKH